jgi:hypothetical protein
MKPIFSLFTLARPSSLTCPEQCRGEIQRRQGGKKHDKFIEFLEFILSSLLKRMSVRKKKLLSLLLIDPCHVF